MNVGIYGLPLRSAARKRRNRRLASIAVLLVLAVAWLGYTVARELPKRPAATNAELQPVVQPLPMRRAVRTSTTGAIVDLPGAPAAQAQPVLPEAPAAGEIPLGAQAAAGTGSTPAWVSPERSLTNDSAHAPFPQMALNHAAGGNGVARRGDVGISGGMGGVGGVGGGQLKAGAPNTSSDDAGFGGSRVGVTGRHEQPGDDTGTPNDGGSNPNKPANGNSGGGNSGGGNSGGGNSGGGNSGGGNSGGGNSGGGNSGGGNSGGGNSGGGNSGGDNSGGDNSGGDKSGGNNNGGNNNGGNNGGGNNGGNNNTPAGDEPPAPIEIPEIPLEAPKDDVQEIPEPGSVLLMLGAAAAIIRHRRR